MDCGLQVKNYNDIQELDYHRSISGSGPLEEIEIAGKKFIN